MPSVTPLERSVHPADALTEAALDEVNNKLTALITALGNTTRADDLLLDEFVRLFNLHPEVVAAMKSSKWQAGEGEPDVETLVAEVKFWLNITDWTVWERQSATEFLSLGTIKGPKGDTGDDSTVPGPKGDQGDVGPAGQAWVHGPIPADETYPSGPPEGLGIKYYFDFTNRTVAAWSGVSWTIITGLLDGPIGYGWMTYGGIPSSAPTNNQVFCLNTINGYVYFWDGDSWEFTGAMMKGIQGDPGVDGTDGAPGGPWIKGSGVPSSGTGSDGDWYLDTESEKVYEKQTGSWVEIADFSGGGGGSLTAPLVLPPATVTGIEFPGEDEYGRDCRFTFSGGTWALEFQDHDHGWVDPSRPFSQCLGEDLIITGGSMKFGNASGNQLIVAAGKCDTAYEFQVSGVRVVGNRITSWSTPNGTTSRDPLDPSSATPEECAKRINAILADLFYHGLFGTSV